MNPYPEQLQAVDYAARAERAAIVMPTGYGKSVTMALLINKLQVRTLVVVPNLTLKLQLRASFKKWFGDTPNLVVENIDSSKLEKLNDFDCLIIDEAHHVAAATYRRLNKISWSGIYYRFFFTATPFRSRSEETLLYESIAGRVAYRVSYHDAVAAGALTPVEAYYIDLPKIEMEGNPASWAAVYKELVVENEYRNKVIAGLIDSLALAKAPTLCLVREITHGEAIQKLSAISPPYAKGENDDNSLLFSAFNSGRIRSLIGTLGVLGEGIDTKPAEYVILGALGKSKNQFMQSVGRGFRRSPGKESCKIILFRDRSHKFTIRHFNAQVRYLKEEYGIVPAKLEVDFA